MIRSFSLLTRFLTFRRELGALWRAFMTPGIPLHLKALMLLVPLYLVSPIDLIPDFIPIAGWLDDLVVVPMLVSWIVSLLPQVEPVRPSRNDRTGDRQGKPVIDGTYRRL